MFADVTSLENWNVSAASLKAVITSKTKALLVVHYAGYPCDMAGIVKLAKVKGLALVEDAAHAPGARLDGRAMGGWGDCGCFSFFSNKNMTTGEGGMLTTDREDVVDRVRRLRSHGMTTLTLDRHKGHAFSYDVIDVGFNYRTGELNAALGLAYFAALSTKRTASYAGRALPRLPFECTGLRRSISEHARSVRLSHNAGVIACRV